MTSEAETQIRRAPEIRQRDELPILMIAGSREATPAMLVAAVELIENAAAQRWYVMVGDAQGIDAAVAQACERLFVPYCAYGLSLKARNGAGNYQRLRLTHFGERDRWIARVADFGCFLWNGRSRGTHSGYGYMRLQNKPALLLDFSRKGEVAWGDAISGWHSARFTAGT